MQSFIRHITGTDERIILLTRAHWIYLVIGATWMGLLAGLGMGLDELLWRYFGMATPFSGREILGFYIPAQVPLLFMLFGGCGAMLFILYAIKALATEIALTNQRVIYKTGLIFVEVEEIDLAEVRAEHIYHGMLGRFLGYGRVRLDSRFVGDIHLPAIKKPYRLVKAMHSARGKIHDPLEGGAAPDLKKAR